MPPVSGSCPAPYVGPGTSGTYCTLPRVLGSLTYNSGTSTYTLVEHPTPTYTFNSSGQLTSIADPDGATEIGHATARPRPGSGNCPSGAGSCETVTSASGRTLTLGWSGCGRHRDDHLGHRPAGSPDHLCLQLGESHLGHRSAWQRHLVHLRLVQLQRRSSTRPLDRDQSQRPVRWPRRR